MAQLSGTAQSFYRWRTKNLKGDGVIWFVILFLSIVSILAVYSAISSLAFRKADGNTEFFLFKHTALLFAGLATMWFFHNIDYRIYSRLSIILLLLSIAFLIFAFFFGKSTNSANRWITIPLVNQTFQPSDLAKLALIAYVSRVLAGNQQNLTDFKKVALPIMGWSLAICGLIALSNASTAVLLFASVILVLFMGRMPIKFFALPILVAALLGGAILLGQRGQTFKNRISRFMEHDSLKPYQQQQSFIAIANGGAVNFNPGGSYQKDTLPEAYNDFIFAVIVEEYGMFGAICVWLAYIALVYRGLISVSKSTSAFGGLLSAGLSFQLVIQAMANMAVAVGMLPVTGQPLPWLSMGGTSLIFTGISFGIILAVSRGDKSFEDSSKLSNNTYQQRGAL